MKKVLFALVLSLGLYASTASATICSATAVNCDEMACVLVPEGGSCIQRPGGSRASVTSYDAAGEFYQFDLVVCPFGE